MPKRFTIPLFHKEGRGRLLIKRIKKKKSKCAGIRGIEELNPRFSRKRYLNFLR